MSTVTTAGTAARPNQPVSLPVTCLTCLTDRHTSSSRPLLLGSTPMCLRRRLGYRWGRLSRAAIACLVLLGHATAAFGVPCLHWLTPPRQAPATSLPACCCAPEAQAAHQCCCCQPAPQKPKPSCCAPAPVVRHDIPLPASVGPCSCKPAEVLTGSVEPSVPPAAAFCWTEDWPLIDYVGGQSPSHVSLHSEPLAPPPRR
jgi:hypothetical protein